MRKKDCKKKMTEERKIERGQVYFLREDDSVGAEISIGRPCVVLNNQELIDKLPTVTVAYMTTSPRNCIDAVKVFTGRKWGYVLLSQIRTIDKSRLNELMWTLPAKDVSRIDTALSYTFSIGKFSNEYENEDETGDENEVLNECGGADISELASLRMELALHKALYEKTLEKLIELRLEKDGVIEKPMVKPVEKPKVCDVKKQKKEISDEEVQQILSSVTAKRGNHARMGKAQMKEGAKPININTASVEEFESIGMGTQTAKSIVGYRKRHGHFIGIEDLLMVPRFGKGCFAAFESVLEV